MESTCPLERLPWPAFLPQTEELVLEDVLPMAASLRSSLHSECSHYCRVLKTSFRYSQKEMAVAFACVYIHTHTCKHTHMHTKQALDALSEGQNGCGGGVTEDMKCHRSGELSTESSPLTWSTGKSLCGPNRNSLVECRGQNSVGLG